MYVQNVVCLRLKTQERYFGSTDWPKNTLQEYTKNTYICYNTPRF